MFGGLDARSLPPEPLWLRHCSLRMLIGSSSLT